MYGSPMLLCACCLFTSMERELRQMSGICRTMGRELLLTLPEAARADSCNLEMQLWTEEVESEVLGTLLPNGALRNLALRLANTEVNAISGSFSSSAP